MVNACQEDEARPQARLQDDYSATWMSQSNMPLVAESELKVFSRDGDSWRWFGSLTHVVQVYSKYASVEKRKCDQKVLNKWRCRRGRWSIEALTPTTNLVW
jgi:hypothetical protein